MRCAIRQAEGLIESNKDARENDTTQQFKKLHYNTADLKVRFDVVGTIHRSCVVASLDYIHTLLAYFHFPIRIWQDA